MASNIMSAAGVDGKVASIISAGLNIVAGVVLCATGIGGALGASMIGSGVGSIGISDRIAELLHCPRLVIMPAAAFNVP